MSVGGFIVILMREIWETPFGNAHLKIDRANKHISEIEQRLLTSSDRYSPSLHITAKTGEQFLYYSPSDRRLRSDIALIAGDAIHNLRCALDIVWGGTVQALGISNSKYCKFPIDPKGTRDKLFATITKSAHIPESSPVVGLMLDGVKCYQGGDCDILAIHALDIDDKHNLLIPMLTVSGVEGVELEHEDGTINRYTIMLTRPNFYHMVVPLNSKIKNHGEVRFEITFREGTPLENLEVIPTLKRLSWKTSKIFRALQRVAQPKYRTN
jgi:hypothetical protein